MKHSPLSVWFAAAPLLLAACAREPSPSAEAQGPVASSETAKPSAEPTAPLEPTSRATVKANGQLGPGRGTLVIDIAPKPGTKLSEGAPLRVRARGVDLQFPEEIRTQLSQSKLPIHLPLIVSDGAQGPAEIDLSYYYCSHGEDASCRPERAALTVQLDLSGHGEGGEAHFSHQPQG